MFDPSEQLIVISQTQNKEEGILTSCPTRAISASPDEDDQLSDDNGAAVDTPVDFDFLGAAVDDVSTHPADDDGASKYDPMVRGRYRHNPRLRLPTRADGLVVAFVVWRRRLLTFYGCWKIAVDFDVDVVVDFVPAAPLVVAIDNSPVPTFRLGHPMYPVDPAIDLLSVGTAHIATAPWFEAPLPWFDTHGPIWVTNIGDWGAKYPLARDQFPKIALLDNWEEEILPIL